MARPEPTAPPHPSHDLHVQSESDSQLPNPPQNPQTIPVDYMQHVPQNNLMQHGTIPGQYLQTNPPYIAHPIQYPPVHQIPSNYHFQANYTQPYTPPPVQFVNAQSFQQVPVHHQQLHTAPAIMVQPPPYLRTTGPVGWTTGLFDCMDDPMNALVTIFFPCLTFGQIAEIVDNGNTSCVTSALLYSALACLIGCPCLLSCTYRTKLRSGYGLLESPAPDWITHFVCEYCALCQEYRELQNRGIDPSIGWHGNIIKNQNVQQYQVTIVPPTNQNMMG